MGTELTKLPGKQKVISIQKIDIKLDELVYRPLESIDSYFTDVLTNY